MIFIKIKKFVHKNSKQIFQYNIEAFIIILLISLYNYHHIFFIIKHFGGILFSREFSNNLL